VLPTVTALHGVIAEKKKKRTLHNQRYENFNIKMDLREIKLGIGGEWDYLRIMLKDEF
jgi:hypothetical protein